MGAAEVSPASSFLSSSDPRIHLGLGDVVRLESVTIDWPDGRQETMRDVAADRILVVHEGRASAAVPSSVTSRVITHRWAD